jgi:hypothetical protein
MINVSNSFALDSNVFIQAKNSYYAFALCPGFWDSLVAHHEAGNVCSIDHVKNELLLGNDELADWSQKVMPASFFHSTQDSAVVAVYRSIMSWVQKNSQFFDLAKADFAASADGWLIAYARVKRCFVVTHEELALEAKKKVPIPNVCREFGVRYKNTFEMLKTLDVHFNWDPAP